MTEKKVPVLITWDVDPDRWASFEQRQRALSMALDLCEKFSIRSTFFITAHFAHEYTEVFRRMKTMGHEIGCHGLMHTDEEEYNRMPEAMQRTYIEDATNELEAAVGQAVRSFRSPRVKISATTLRLLTERGYSADSTVCSQRVDLVSSNLINPGWLVAPRRPYHPHQTDPYRRGNLSIWEVPVSALVIPFISGSLNVFGVRFMKPFFRLLLAESRRTTKPIVYLAHPPEFIRPRRKKSCFTLQAFSPSYIRTHGFLIRRALYKMDGPTWFNATRELFAYMSSFSDVAFMTNSEYVSYLDGRPDASSHEATDSRQP